MRKYPACAYPEAGAGWSNDRATVRERTDASDEARAGVAAPPDVEQEVAPAQPRGHATASPRPVDHGPVPRVAFTSVTPRRVGEVASGGAGASPPTVMAVGGASGATSPSACARLTIRWGADNRACS